ncbi:MBOAT family O-acyltransferase [Rhizobium sp. BK377]|uniref:MBOAT family O-acyltransferase n=1 Tax=Rhizobium sp. BK377 TaxID=2587058 RepID=UPI00160A574B|nr:MBOAT family O-acyltransferase [Rhizobium sp. BK377]MBB3463087.1 D-alanyl-lipoteichoic acid acyltransferase DltB (MBOAT superfamily) [Rhizobium sp. BK377]
MAIFATTAFVWVVAAMYILIHVPLNIPRSVWYGVLNLGALVILLGWRAAALALAFAVVYWVALGVLQRVVSQDREVLAQRLAIALYASVAVIFICHKLVLERANDFVAWLPFHLLSVVSNSPPFLSGFKILQLVAFSYVCLRLVDAVRAVSAGARVLSPVGLLGYLVPFFMTPSGPVNEYDEHVAMDKSPLPAPTASHFVDSVFLIVIGYFLKFTCAQSYGIFVRGLDGPWPVATLLDSTVFLIYVLIEFTGYSMIALGVGRLIHVPTPMNFNHPYMATSFADFWTRWHMSLGSFVRRTMYFPIRMSLSRAVKPKRGDKLKIHAINTAALLVPFAFVGVWHRFNWPFVLWGLAVGVVVAIETILRDEFFSKRKSPLPAWVIRSLVSLYSVFLVAFTLQVALADFAK